MDCTTILLAASPRVALSLTCSWIGLSAATTVRVCVIVLIWGFAHTCSRPSLHQLVCLASSCFTSFAGLSSALVVLVLMSTHLKLLNWNVRGLNDRARRTVVRNLVLTSRCSILSVQESKLGALTGNDITDIVGQTLTGFAQLPALGTRGGVLLFWCPDRFHATNVDVREFSITVTLVDRQYGHA
jgi:hypothetical protein